MSRQEKGQETYLEKGHGLVNASITSERAPIQDMDGNQFQRVVTSIIRQVFGAERHAAKRLSEAAGVTVETAKNWLKADIPTTPQGLHLMRLMATVPELQAEMLRLTAIETTMPAEFEQAFLAAARVYRRIKAAEDE